MKLQLVHICLITNNYHTLLLNLLLWHVPLDILSYHFMGVKVVVGGSGHVTRYSQLPQAGVEHLQSSLKTKNVNTGIFKLIEKLI